MSMKTRNAFTLVELLVVIAIIGTLASMTIPAVMQAIESSRRSVCQNNLKSLGQAVQTYKSKTDGAFPGYSQKIGQGINPVDGGQGVGQGIRVPWTVVLLNHLEQVNLYKQWRKTADPANLAAALKPQLEVYICPSRPDVTSDPLLSYVMNCGEGAQQAGSVRNLANGLGVDRFAFPGLRATDATLEDGASYTLLFSENLQAGNWTSSEKKDVGMVWWKDNPPPANAKINENKRNATPTIQTARPSSMHYGGANFCFADGRTLYIAENISYQVYRQLMAPSDNKSEITPPFSPLSDGDFQ